MFEESALIFSEFRGIRGIWNLKKITYFIFEFSLSDFECLTVSLPNCDQNVKIQQNLQISFCKMRTKIVYGTTDKDLSFERQPYMVSLTDSKLR